MELSDLTNEMLTQFSGWEMEIKYPFKPQFSRGKISSIQIKDGDLVVEFLCLNCWDEQGHSLRDIERKHVSSLQQMRVYWPNSNCLVFESMAGDNTLITIKNSSLEPVVSTRTRKLQPV